MSFHWQFFSARHAGKDLPAEYLEQIYDNIVKNEIKLNVEGPLLYPPSEIYPSVLL
jgi:hypothetical protein